MEKLELDGNNFTKEESMDFLINEYNQCFEQMRHYDNVQGFMMSFGISFYTAIATLMYFIYKQNIVEPMKHNYIKFVILLAFYVGLLLFFFFIRNRRYFAIVARQVNSIRNYFLNNSELNFIMYNKMYIDPENPKYLNFWSTDTIYLSIFIVMNSVLVYCYCFLQKIGNPVLLGFIAFAFQIFYLFLSQNEKGE